MSRTRKPSITGPSLARRTSTSTQSRIRPIDILQNSPDSRASDRDQYRSPSDAVFIKESPNIERARQPYTAKPGNGKVYTETLDVPNTSRPGRAYSTGRGPRDHEPEPDHRPRHVRTYSNASSNRPSGTRRTQSPPMRSYGQSDPTALDTGGSYPPEKYSSPPKQPSLSPTSAYTTTKYVPSSAETRDRERDRDRERYSESRRSEKRNTSDQPRSRRNTLNNPPQLLPEIITPRNTERWDQIYENRDKSRDREWKFEPKSAGPILHQEFRPDARPAPSDSLGEERYLRAPRSGEYEVGKGQKYYERR